MKIAKHTVPTVEYTLKGENGQILDSTDGRGALVYLHGVGGVIPGLESALEGKAAGDRISVRIPPQQAFGPHDPKLVLAVARNSFSGVDQIRVGMQFRAQTTAGPRVVTVVEVADDTITVDANHPLAGQTVNLEARVLDVREATEEEISHAHVCHGDGSCGNPCH